MEQLEFEDYPVLSPHRRIRSTRCSLVMSFTVLSLTICIVASIVLHIYLANITWNAGVIITEKTRLAAATPGTIALETTTPKVMSIETISAEAVMKDASTEMVVSSEAGVSSSFPSSTTLGFRGVQLSTDTPLIITHHNVLRSTTTVRPTSSVKSVIVVPTRTTSLVLLIERPTTLPPLSDSFQISLFSLKSLSEHTPMSIQSPSMASLLSSCPTPINPSHCSNPHPLPAP